MQGSVSHNGSDVHMSPSEFKIICCMAKNGKNITTRQQILSEVWNNSVSNRNIDVHIRHLRKKLGDGINTHLKLGYSLSFDKIQIISSNNDSSQENKLLTDGTDYYLIFGSSSSEFGKLTILINIKTGMYHSVLDEKIKLIYRNGNIKNEL